MELVLENFRCFAQARLNLPPSGLLLLNGPSGIGKSTIFKAIHFALYGKEQKVVQFGQKRAKVTLKTNINGESLVITRATNPASLIVHYKNTSLIKDSAQALIIELVGNYFCQTSYLSQKSVENFLTLTQNERTTFLESCNANHEPIQALKESCKNKIRERKANLTKAQTEVETLAPIVPFQQAPQPPVYPYTDKTPSQEVEERDKNKQKLDEARAELERFNSLQTKYTAQASKLEQIQVELTSCVEWLAKNPAQRTTFDKQGLVDWIAHYKGFVQIWDQLELYTTAKSNLELLRQQRLEELEKCQQEYTPFDAVEYKNVQQQLDAQRHLFQQIKGWNEVLPDTLDPSKDDVVAVAKKVLAELISECVGEQNQYDTSKFKLQLKECNDRIALLQQELKGCKEACNGKEMTCPSCKNGLSIHQNKLILFNKVQESEKLKGLEESLKVEQKKALSLQKEIDTCTSALDEIQDELNDYRRIEKQVLISSGKCNEISELSEKVKVLQKQEHSANSMLDKIETLKVATKREKELEKECARFRDCKEPAVGKGDCQDRLTELQKDYTLACIEEASVASHNKKRDEVESKAKEYKKLLDQPRLTDQTEAISKCKAEVERRIERENKFSKRAKKIEAYNMELKEYNMHLEGWKRLVKARSDASRWEQALLTAEKGFTCLVEAETFSLLQTINTINLELDQFTSAFFDNKLSIALRPFKETAKGDKKHCIDLQITKEGEDVGVDSLSGGEYDRCVLALFLSFNLVTNKKWLFLDECLSSLHAEAVEDILEYIKDKWKSQLVCVTLHQANTGMFDDVVDVCCLR